MSSMVNIRKLSYSINDQVEKLSSKRTFTRRRLRSSERLRRAIDSSILRTAEHLASQCNDKQRCLDIAITLLRLYDPYDVLSYIGQKVQEGLDVERVLQQLASMLSIDMIHDKDPNSTSVTSQGFLGKFVERLRRFFQSKHRD